MFIDKLDNDKNHVDHLALEYAQSRLSYINPEVKGLKVKFSQIADLITLQVSGVVKGESKGGQKTWTKMEILTITVPVTHLIENVLRDVFEVPSEGTSVS